MKKLYKITYPIKGTVTFFLDADSEADAYNKIDDSLLEERGFDDTDWKLDHDNSLERIIEEIKK